MKLRSRLKFFLASTMLAAGVLAACTHLLPGPPNGGGIFYVTLEAQTLPLNKTFSWDAPAVDSTHGAATGYIVTLDGVTVGSPTVTSQAVVFTTAGVHTLTVAGTNLFGTGAVATLVVTVAVPATPANPRLQ